MRTVSILLILGSVLFVGLACQDASRQAKESAPIAMTAAVSPQQQEHAKQLFAAWCSGCHGERGKGDGPAALVLDAKPRNFTKEAFKIRSTPSGQPPLRTDVFDTITRGLPGSSMPSFKFLAEDERWLLTDYVRKMAGIDAVPDPKAIELGKERAASAESIARGKELYAKLGCEKCHGATGRGDGPSSNTLMDSQGRLIPARDYTKGQYMGGDTAAAIHMRFQSGMDGTPMPSFDSAMTIEEGWDLTHYVLSLRIPPAAPPSDPEDLGRRVVQERQCNACHMIEGHGGDVGPSLDVAAVKLRYDWIKSYLTDPLKFEKLYLYMPYRMPRFDLSEQEVDAVVTYFAKLANRPVQETPVEAKLDESKLASGQLIYFLKCTECHNMGSVIPTPLAKQQGPDLIQVSNRIRYDWIPIWVNNPKQVYPLARMVDTNLTKEEIEAVQAFIWKTSVDAQPKMQASK